MRRSDHRVFPFLGGCIITPLGTESQTDYTRIAVLAKGFTSCKMLRSSRGQAQGAATQTWEYWKCDPVLTFARATRKSRVPHSDSWPGLALLAQGPSANRKSIKPAKYILLLCLKRTGISILTRGVRQIQLSQLQGRKRVTSGLPFTQGQRNWETREG